MDFRLSPFGAGMPTLDGDVELCQSFVFLMDVDAFGYHEGLFPRKLSE